MSAIAVPTASLGAVREKRRGIRVHPLCFFLALAAALRAARALGIAGPVYNAYDFGGGSCASISS